MAFILLVREGDAIRLFTPTMFESRQAALAELPRAGAITGAEELFLVDLDTATPVIVVSHAPAAAPVPPPPVEELPAEESVGVWEAPPPVEQLAEELGEPVEEPIAELAPPPEADDDLHSALRRAAGALESAGIAAPASITLAPEPEPAVADVAPAAWPWDVADEQPPEPAEPESASLDAESPVEELAAFEDMGDLTAIAESLDVEESATDETPEPYVPDPLEEPARDVEPLVHADGGDEAITLSRPVIMGSYDTADGSITIEVPEAELAAYEAGSSDITELTCVECVYIATCPKKGESDPSSCGSFQWKSV